MPTDTERMETMNDRELVLKAQGIARTLTYNEEPQGAAKHIILEMAHRLGNQCGFGNPGLPAAGSLRPINCDHVAWMLNAIDRYLPRRAELPRCSVEREMQKLGLLYELMDAAGLKFQDDAARYNGTPASARPLRAAIDAAMGEEKRDG